MEAVEEVNPGKPEKGLSWEGMVKKHFPEKAVPRYEATKFAGVFKYVGKTGVSYGIDFYDSAGRKHREVVGPSMAEAKEKLEEIHTQVRKGDFVANRKKYTFDDLKKKYEEIYQDQTQFQNSRKYYMPILSNFFGTRKLYTITSYDIEVFRKTRMDTPTKHGRIRSKVATNRELQTLQHMFSKGVEWQLMEKNPFDRFRSKRAIFFEESKGRVRYLEPNEVQALLSAAPPYLRNIIRGALLTGLRKGDLLRLKWEDVDLDKRILLFTEEKKRGRRQTKILCSDMINLLMGIRKGKSEFIFNGPIPQKKGEDNQSYVALPDPDGRPLKDCQRSFRSALKKAGIKDFHFHDLRHTSASYMVMRGASMKAVQEHLGHSSVAMSEKYSHLSPQFQKTEVERLNGVFTEACA